MRGGEAFLTSSARSKVSGGVPERPKGADCKSVGIAFGGSNPPPSTSAHVAQLVERVLGKDEVHGFESRRGLQASAVD